MDVSPRQFAEPRYHFYIPLLLGVAFSVILGMEIGSGSVSRVLIMVGIVAGIFMLARPALAGMLCVLGFGSGVTAPGIPEHLNISLLMGALIVGIVLVSRALKGLNFPPLTSMHRWLLFFTGVLLLTMAIRGAGLKAFGSSMWGGMFYVQLLLTIGLIFTLPLVRISALRWPILLFLMGLSAAVPVTLTILLKAGWPVNWLGDFFSIGSEDSGETLVAGSTAVDRLATTGTGIFLFIALAIVVPIRNLLGIKNFYLLPILFGIVILTLMSGSRTAAVTIGLNIIIMAYLGKALKPSNLLAGFTLCMLVLGMAIVLEDKFPPAVQRSLAWVPGFKVGDVAMNDAQGTLLWRLDLWHEGIRLFPQYWLVGKGFAFSEQEIRQVTGEFQGNDNLGWAIVTTSFHNGILSLAVGLGVMGFVAGFGLMISAWKRHWRFYKGMWNDPLLQRCHYLLFGYFIAQEVSYVLFYGDVHVSFPILFSTLAILEGLRQADVELGEKQARHRKSTESTLNPRSTLRPARALRHS